VAWVWRSMWVLPDSQGKDGGDTLGQDL
jgi:hypothetical protein